MKWSVSETACCWWFSTGVIWLGWIIAIWVAILTGRRYHYMEIYGVLYHRTECGKWMDMKYSLKNQQPIGSQQRSQPGV